MAHNINQVKGRIKTRNEEDPELDAAMNLAKEASRQESTNRTNELKRDDSLGKHRYYIQVAAIYVIGASVLAMFLVIVANHVFPDRWLKADQLASLESFLFHGVIGAVLTAFAKFTVRN